ncbi:MAG: hypothetical protein IPH62_13450 [Ignavibacteriae bacterium]|nr:hypothetical protein [Ignavibacteriota bacterium]
MNESFKYLIPIFGMIFVGWLTYLDYKNKHIINKEKTALIEKGMDPSLLDTKPKNQNNNFKIGLLFIGISLGVLAGYLLNIFLNVPNFVAYSTMILAICGIMLVYFHKSEIS